MVINTGFANAIPHFSNYDGSNSVIKKADRQGTIDNLMNQMELMAWHDDYMKSQDKYYKTPKEVEDEFNKYKKELDKLGVSFENFRGRYFKKHPTPEMQAWDKAGEMMNNRFYNTLGPSPSQQKQEEQKSLQRTGKKFRYLKPDNRVVL